MAGAPLPGPARRRDQRLGATSSPTTWHATADGRRVRATPVTVAQVLATCATDAVDSADPPRSRAAAPVRRRRLLPRVRRHVPFGAAPLVLDGALRQPGQGRHFRSRNRGCTDDHGDVRPDGRRDRAHVGPGPGLAAGPAATRAGRAAVPGRRGRAGRSPGRRADPGRVLGRPGAGRPRCAPASTSTPAVEGPVPAQDVGHAGHAAPAARGRVADLDRGDAHPRVAHHAGVGEVPRHHEGRARRRDRGHPRGAGRRPAHPRRAGRPRGRASRAHDHLGDVLRSGWAQVFKPAANQGLLCQGPPRGTATTFTAPARVAGRGGAARRARPRRRGCHRAGPLPRRQRPGDPRRRRPVARRSAPRRPGCCWPPTPTASSRSTSRGRRRG